MRAALVSPLLREEPTMMLVFSCPSVAVSLTLARPLRTFREAMLYLSPTRSTAPLFREPPPLPMATPPALPPPVPSMS